MSNSIKVRRGLESNLPTLSEGEFGFATDSAKVWIGDGASNHQLLMKSTFDTHIGTSDIHHAKYTDSEARGSINDIFGSDGRADKNIELNSHSVLQSNYNNSEGKIPPHNVI